MPKMDLKKDFRELYFPPNDPVFVEVPAMNFLMVDGRGNPNTAAAFREAIEVLYGMSYTLKFASKRRGGQDYTVMPLEALWWTGDSGLFSMDAKEEWSWTAMITQPEHISQHSVQDAAKELREKKDPRALAKARFQRFDEGPAAQVMHVGPYAAEGPTIERLHNFIKENGYKLAGKHHEIYLGDPRRTKPERLKTVIRQPVGR